jgi:hypothetical protein
LVKKFAAVAVCTAVLSACTNPTVFNSQQVRQCGKQDGDWKTLTHDERVEACQRFFAERQGRPTPTNSSSPPTPPLTSQPVEPNISYAGKMCAQGQSAYCHHLYNFCKSGSHRVAGWPSA